MLKLNDVMISRVINKTIRTVDTVEMEKQYAKHKIPINNELIDIEARICFKAGVIAKILKYYYRVN